MTPAARRKAVQMIRDSYGLSERKACEAIGVARSTIRYRPKVSAFNDELRDRLVELSLSRPRAGYRMMHTLLRREGIAVNAKRIYRLYRSLDLQVRRKRRRQVAQANRQPRQELSRPNQRWAMDFMGDALADGRTLRTLNVLDEHTRESLAIDVDCSIPGLRVCRVLDRAVAQYGLPEQIVVDNGPEFRSKALDQWAYRHGVELVFISPGKPTENCFIESFNGTFRNECLNLHWFATLWSARSIIEAWRLDYNETRPHSSLGNQPPAVFASSFRNGRLDIATTA